nr:Ig-like domain-containing protein [Lysinibacter cavernae]
MGKVSVEYSVDDAEDIAAALLQTDNSDGHTGITWKSGEIPLNARALRFVTEKPIDSGFSGSATITVALKGLAIGGQLKNDFYGKTAAVDGDPNSIKRIVGAAEVTLASSAGSLSGTAWRDLDYSNGFTPEDVVWPKGSKTLTITSTNETYTTDIGDDGSFDFGVIAAGDYVASVKDAKGWTLVLPNPISFAIGQELDDVKILFQEKLTDLALKPDTGSTSAGASTVIDVKKNDSWYTASAPAPQTAASIQAGGEATYGTATITRDGSLTYVSSATWPAEFDGQDSYEDIVAYTVTDSAGATATTAVTITVYAAPVATNDAVTIGQSGSTAADALANDTGRKLVLGNTVLASGDLSVSVADGKVSVESTHEWADGEATYNDVVSYSVTDDFGQTADAEIVVTVQRAPVVTVDAAQTVATGESARFEPQLLNPGVIADDGVAVTKQPAGGTVAVAADGTVSFDHGSAQPGEYTFTVTYTDNLGQQTEQAFTVTVYAALAPVDDSKTVPWTAATTTDVLANDGGDGLTLTAASTTDETESSGLVEVVGDGIRFTPSANRQWAEGELNYIEIVKYTVTDGHGGESRATLTLTVIRPPVGKDVHFELTNDVDLLTFDPVGEASGTDVQEIDADAVVTQAAHGTASVTNGVLGYTPKPGYVGEDTFSVRIVDALGQTGEVTYTLTILAADVPEPKPTLPNTGGTEVPMNPTPGTAAPSEGGTAGATGSGHNGAPGNPALAVTGSDHSPIAAIAMLLLLGGCLVAAARRHNVPGGQRTL